MSADAGDAPDSFAGLSPAGYHRWRLESELYRGVERPTLLPMLEAVPFGRALDIGCGTGIWTCILKQLRPESECVGIDIAREMISLAARECPARFEAADALAFRDGRRFDLVISALSADYIGFPGFFATLAANLADTGIAYAWFLDPRRYPRVEGHRVKTWDVDGRPVRVEIPDYDVTRVAEIGAEAGIRCAATETPFCLRDRIQRTLLCLKCTRK